MNYTYNIFNQFFDTVIRPYAGEITYLLTYLIYLYYCRYNGFLYNGIYCRYNGIVAKTEH